MPQLMNQNDLNTLGNFAANNDRIGYYNFLRSKGDRYGDLALGVVKNEGFSGRVANAYIAAVAEDAPTAQNDNHLTRSAKFQPKINLLAA